MGRAFFVYMMSSKSRTLYTGITNNLSGRIGQHKDGLFDSFTADYNCTRLVWYERHKYINNAISREKQIKRWRREKKVFLIEQMNPTWKDLAEKWWHVPVFLGHKEAAKTGPSTTLRSGPARKTNLERHAKKNKQMHSRSSFDFLVESHNQANDFVIPTEAERSGGTRFKRFKRNPFLMKRIFCRP